MEDTLAPPRNVTTYIVHKLTYSDGRAYRYHVSDDAGNVRYVAERTGMQLPSPTRLVEFFDPDHNPSGRLQPPATVPWLRGTRYEIFVGEETEEQRLAELRALGAPLCWAVYSVVVKPMLREESSLVVMFLCVTVMGLPLLAWMGTDLGDRMCGRGPGAFGPRDWGLLLYLIGPCTLFGFPVWNWLVKHLPASTVGFTVFLNPPLTFGFSYLLQGVVPLPLEIAGAVVVLAGVGGRSILWAG